MAIDDDVRDVIHSVTDYKIRVKKTDEDYAVVFLHDTRSEENDLLERTLSEEGFSVYPVTVNNITKKFYVD